MNDTNLSGQSSRPVNQLVLASTSVYRRSLLERAGISFRCRAPLCDESALVQQWAALPAQALAEELAMAKAVSLVDEEPEATIIGCDQIASFDGQIFEKPMTHARAVEQLRAMSGKVHELITAVVVIDGPRVIRHTDITRLWMRAMTPEAIERYVTADQPLDCAGSYKLESRGIVLFERIDTADHTAITGLPLIALVTILRELGFTIP